MSRFAHSLLRLLACCAMCWLWVGGAAEAAESTCSAPAVATVGIPEASSPISAAKAGAPSRAIRAEAERVETVRVRFERAMGTSGEGATRGRSGWQTVDACPHPFIREISAAREYAAILSACRPVGRVQPPFIACRMRSRVASDRRITVGCPAARA